MRKIYVKFYCKILSQNNSKKGISLIALIISIIVIIILSLIVIVNLQNNLINGADEAIFKQNVGEYKSELYIWVSNEYAKNNGNLNLLEIDATKTSGSYKGLKEQDIIKSMSNNDADKFEIQDGKLVYAGSNSDEQDWTNDIGIDDGTITPIINTANKPILATGMTAIKWNGSTFITTNTSDSDWYNYEEHRWANAQTADGSMWVWIPRYEYNIPISHSSTVQLINVKFMNGTSTVADSGYIVHPAFTFGDTELTGIWVAKFEASGSETAIDIKAGEGSIRGIKISRMFDACRNMETNDKYGWGTSGIEIDTHLMKNIEWGAVAYISNSIYGKAEEIWINPNEQYLTGQAGTEVSANVISTTYGYNNETYGINASTTGNIYGIYDMSGGSWEYVAAYVNNGNSYLSSYGGNLTASTTDLKYVDIYEKGLSDTRELNYSMCLAKKGDALYETSTNGGNISVETSWYTDYSSMPSTNTPFFIRGGECDDSINAGIFAFGGYSGSNSWMSFRPVMVLDSKI